jgi:hypothetical protein
VDGFAFQISSEKGKEVNNEEIIMIFAFTHLIQSADGEIKRLIVFFYTGSLS